jgi:hypothetical protein
MNGKTKPPNGGFVLDRDFGKRMDGAARNFVTY